MKSKTPIIPPIRVVSPGPKLGKHGGESEDRFNNGEPHQDRLDTQQPFPAVKSAGTTPVQPTGKVKVAPRKVVVSDIPASDPRYKDGLRVVIRDPIADTDIGAFVDHPAATSYMKANDMSEGS